MLANINLKNITFYKVIKTLNKSEFDLQKNNNSECYDYKDIRNLRNNQYISEILLSNPMESIVSCETYFFFKRCKYK